jgi:glycosyltransferase involved in cell wall biosynthesis
LFQKHRQRGHGSYLAVGKKTSNDPNVFEIPNNAHRNLWAGIWREIKKRLTKYNIRLLPGVARGLASLGEPRRWLERQKGIEDFNFPGTCHLLNLSPQHPDILHAHVLHSGYFDLGMLPKLSCRIPTVITLHDEWMMTGYCACTLGCERWKLGCGQCPDLTIYPAIKRDATAYNWKRKQDIYERSRFYIATPSKWLMDKVNCSILNFGIIESRVIPNGVDLLMFHPSDKQSARQALDLPRDTWIGLFVGHGTQSNKLKDYFTIKEAVLKFAAQSTMQKHILICLGEKGSDQRTGSTLIRFLGYQSNLEKVAQYYRASDVYLHGTRADNFPNSILEALACGIPVVATSVGGIPEQIDDGLTGFLVPPGDSSAMAMRMRQLQENDELRQKMSIRAADSAKRRFGLERMVEDYLAWYKEILKSNIH